MHRQLNQKEVFNPKQTKQVTTLRSFVPGVIAAVTTLCFFVCCLLLFPFTKFFPDTLPIGPTKPINWDFLGSMTSLATFSLVLGGLVFAFTDYVQNAVQRKREESESSFNMYKEMYDRLMNPESTTARRWVILNLPTLEKMNNDKAAWMACIRDTINEIPAGSVVSRAPGKEYVKQILNDFDFIGFVNNNYWKMENELVEWMSSPVAKVWERIYQYVEDEADTREEPDYYESAREFGYYCMEWRRKNRPPSKVIPNAI